MGNCAATQPREIDHSTSQFTTTKQKYISLATNDKTLQHDELRSEIFLRANLYIKFYKPLEPTEESKDSLEIPTSSRQTHVEEPVNLSLSLQYNCKQMDW